VNGEPSASEQQLVCEQTSEGWRIALRSGGIAEAVIEPLSIEINSQTMPGRWESANLSKGVLRAEGTLSHPGGQVRSTLEASPGQGDMRVELAWSVKFEGGQFTGAILHPVNLYGVEGDPTALDLPTIHYGCNTYGKGLFPHPDPRKGFAFRADRLAQPAIHYAGSQATWSYFAADEAPLVPQPDLVYSLGIVPLDSGLGLFFRYPQREYGHRGDGSLDAYVAKNTFAPGEEVTLTWQPGDELHKTLYFWCRLPSDRPDYSAPARFLWQRAYQWHAVPVTTSLWEQAGRHIRWFNARLYNPDTGGGQYESPEGSNTAMLGFVEQSLSMAAATFVYSCFSLAASEPSFPAAELDELRDRAAGALTRWATEGCNPDGLLYPACDRSGYFFGYRDYSDYENLTIVRDEGFDTIRLASEARALLWAARNARFSRFAVEWRTWEDAAVGVADWMMQHRLPGGGYASRYRRDGEPLDDYPGGTGAVISLLCECAHLMHERATRTGENYTQQAVAAYESTLAGLVRACIFAGGTLDASCPDREAANGALDACVQLYELTGNKQYLEDAKLAADNILSYTMVYPISTFGPDTDAARQDISTFGASIVSPENQHLDPVPTAPWLLLYGLYAGDEICVQAATESLKWTLDGRWAIHEEEGLKQSEQLLHTRWYYNTFFTRRGDYRRGMPLWGSLDSEHGWPQVVPTGALLGSGQVVVDWVSGRAASVDGWRVESALKESGDLLSLELNAVGMPARGLLLRVLRLPFTNDIMLKVNGVERHIGTTQLGHGYMLDLADVSRASIEISNPLYTEEDN
jgi:hypothetical protein